MASAAGAGDDACATLSGLASASAGAGDDDACVSLSGLPASVYARAVSAFARGAGGTAFLPSSAASLEAAARDALGPLFSSRRFSFFAPRAAARWPRGLALGAFDIFVGALFPGRSLEGAVSRPRVNARALGAKKTPPTPHAARHRPQAHAGLVLHLLFPSRASTLSPAALDEMVAASSPGGADDVSAELSAMLRRWAGVDDAAPAGAGITREGFLRMTYELEDMTAALEADEAAAAAAVGEAQPHTPGGHGDGSDGGGEPQPHAHSPP